MSDDSVLALAKAVDAAEREQRPFANRVAATTTEIILAREVIRLHASGSREQGLEEAARIIESNTLVSGSIGPLMDHGWNLANEAGAAAIRSLLARGEQGKGS